MKVPGSDTGSMARKSMTARPGNRRRSVRKASAMPRSVVNTAVVMEAIQLFFSEEDCRTPSMK